MDTSIQSCFMNTGSKDLRPIFMGQDKLGNIYFRIPFFREIRVYKQTRLPIKVVSICLLKIHSNKK